MNEKQLSRFNAYFVGFVILTIWSLLIWQYFHDGVPSHHFLQSADYPAMSNWWGGLLLPILSWGLLARIKNRLIKSSPESVALLSKKAAISFVISLVYGAILSLTFLYGYSDVSAVLFPGILFFALFFRVYREEFILGFILSMSFVFGAILPIIFGTVIATCSAIVYFFVHFILSCLKKFTAKKQIV